MKRSSRAERTARALSRVKQPIPDDLKSRDPLLRRRRTVGAKIGWVGVVLVTAVVMHAVVLVGFAVAATVMKADRPKIEDDGKIEVAVIEQPPPPPPPPVVEPEPEPEVEKAPVVEKPKPKPKKVRPKPKKADPPPPDPIDQPDVEPPPPTKPPPRRIVGLSMESTVNGGGGPAFAVGNTRMGETERVAEKPDEAKPLPKTTKPPPPAKTNRRAARVPTAGPGKIVPPKPLDKVKPAYPEIYRAQNLEAKVIVQVTVGVDGRPKNARVIKPSQYEKFNEIALEAAKKWRFEPATRNGKPVELTIPLPFTFRIVN